MGKKKRPYLRTDWFWQPDDLHRLWTAVLSFAIDDAIYGPADWETKDIPDAERSGYVRQVQEDAQKWINSDSVEVRSFLWVCSVLGLEPDWLRKMITKGKRD